MRWIYIRIQNYVNIHELLPLFQTFFYSTMEKDTVNATEFNRKILARHPYRGILKKIADELGVTRVIITRRIDMNDPEIMELVLRKMLEINRKAQVQQREWTALARQVVQVANGATDLTANDGDSTAGLTVGESTVPPTSVNVTRAL